MMAGPIHVPRRGLFSQSPSRILANERYLDLKWTAGYCRHVPMDFTEIQTYIQGEFKYLHAKIDRFRRGGFARLDVWDVTNRHRGRSLMVGADRKEATAVAGW